MKNDMQKEMGAGEQTNIVIIGAGVSGLTLAIFLHQAQIPCIVLEKRSRAYIETRQRAGVVDARSVQMFERWGLADKLLGGPVAETIDYRVNGRSRIFTTAGDDGSQGRFCTQQMLVSHLLHELVDVRSTDVRFNVADVDIYNGEEHTGVSYRDGEQVVHIDCNYIAGCDADRGVSRASIPGGILTQYAYEYGYAWLAILVETPLAGNAIMAVSDYGFVGQLPRGPQRSRYYLQCALDDGPENWTDERIWDEIRLRLADNSIESAPVINIDFVPFRSVVYAPMQFRNLFLAGDAAHLVPPVSAKGMNLGLYDVDILAQALVKAVRDNDTTALNNYSDTVLPHTWNYQDFAIWMADTMHDAGDSRLHGTFRQMIARARLDNLFQSATAARLHSEYQRGTN